MKFTVSHLVLSKFPSFSHLDKCIPDLSRNACDAPTLPPCPPAPTGPEYNDRHLRKQLRWRPVIDLKSKKVHDTYICKMIQ